MQEQEVLTAKDFRIVGVKQDETDVLSEKTISFWGEVFQTFIRNKLAIFGLILLVIIFLMEIYIFIMNKLSAVRLEHNMP